MKEQADKPYLESPDVVKKTTTEQMIYGSGETLDEKEKKRKEQEKKMLNEVAINHFSQDIC